ncbi:hypothetical protein B0I37DRAFT_109515 [Chaetomium sp. MPI-CAGE-AT-0009]|nr:hypothetical protein B0I37DRAFT_109515 [Chaetomium sp. MPI-CAGE-AT-0009]
MFYQSLLSFSLLIHPSLRFSHFFFVFFLALRGVVLAAGWDLVRFERIWERRCHGGRSVGRSFVCCVFWHRAWARFAWLSLASIMGDRWRPLPSFHFILRYTCITFSGSAGRPAGPLSPTSRGAGSWGRKGGCGPGSR